MLDVFQTDDGVFHQAVLSLNKLVLVRLVVERFALTSGFLLEWEWMVWAAAELWEGDGLPVTGREPSLALAKRAAFDTGISLLADLTRDRATALPELLAMRQTMQWPAGDFVKRH